MAAWKHHCTPLARCCGVGRCLLITAVDSLNSHMAEPEPESEGGELKLDAGQKIDGFVKARLKDHDETSELGLSGPSIRGQVCLPPPPKPHRP